MTSTQPDAATQAMHEDLFETQISLQTRLLDYIEAADEFHVLDQAWEEFTNYEQRDMDPEDPEPVLHFFPWALFYWRRDVPEEALTQARDELLGGDAGSADSANASEDSDWLDDLDDETIEQVLNESLEDDDGLDAFDEDDDVDYVSLPSIATLFMNSVDGADGADSKALEHTLTAQDRDFIEAAARAPFSFFKITAVGPGAFVTLQDLIVPSEVNVYAPALVDMSEEDDIIYGQVVNLHGANLLCAVAPAVLPPVIQEPLEEARQRIEELVPELGDDWRYDLEFELRALYHQMVQRLQDEFDNSDEISGQDGESSSPTRH